MKVGDKAKEIIGAIAPTIGAALGGPFGALAGKVLSGVLKGDEKAVEEAVLSGDPNALAQVKIAEIEFQKRLEELGIEREKLAYADTANARAREMTLKDRTPAVLAGLITVGFFVVLGTLMAYPDAKDSDPLLIMLGSLGTAWATVVAYYFGSSAGSQRKTAELAKLAKMP